jgi:hypothetical protein
LSPADQPAPSPRAGGLAPGLAELALSVGGYYLLHALGVGVFWALTAPAIAVAIVTTVVTARRRRVDMIGLVVLLEIGAALTLSLATHTARAAAAREPAYILIAGVFCLATLWYRTPLSHVSTVAIATFGDPKREAAFDRAWRTVPRYRMWQRLITTSLGVIMTAAAAVQAYIVLSAPATQIAHAINVSNTVVLVMVAALVAVSAILIQGPKRIIEDLLKQA